MNATTIQTRDHPIIVERFLNLSQLLEKKSHFLFGPRQTGKTFLIRQTLKGARIYDFLNTTTFLALNQELVNRGRATISHLLFRFSVPELGIFKTYIVLFGP